MTNLVVLAGVPGAGKSTWAKTFFDLHYAIVSSDNIRKALYSSLTAANRPEARKEANQQTFKQFHMGIEQYLDHGVDVVADATSLTRDSRKKLLAIAKEHKAQAHLVLFKNTQEAVSRNAARDKDSKVPEDPMQNMMRKYYNTLAEIIQEPWASVTKVESFKT